jgi:hypothetical protein
VRAPLREKRHNERRQSLVDVHLKDIQESPDIWTTM